MCWAASHKEYNSNPGQQRIILVTLLNADYGADSVPFEAYANAVGSSSLISVFQAVATHILSRTSLPTIC